MLLIPPISSRTLRPVHDAWVAALHMVEEMLRHLIELAVAAATEEGYPQILPHMTISGGRVLVHHATVWAEHYLLSLVVVIIDGHPGQALCLVELVNHILPFILERHVGRYDGYQWAISLVLRSEPKPDTCLVTPALVYKGSHSSSNLKSLGLHLARRPSLSRWSILYSPMMVGGRVSSTAHLSQKPGQESKSSWVASSPS